MKRMEWIEWWKRLFGITKKPELKSIQCSGYGVLSANCFRCIIFYDSQYKCPKITYQFVFYAHLQPVGISKGIVHGRKSIFAGKPCKCTWNILKTGNLENVRSWDEDTVIGEKSGEFVRNGGCWSYFWCWKHKIIEFFQQ